MDIDIFMGTVRGYSAQFKITADFLRELAKIGQLTAAMCDVFLAAGRITDREYLSLILTKGVV